MQFLKLCEEGKLDQLSACSLEGVDGHVKARAFRASCEDGHLDTARWIYSLGDVDIHTRRDHAFRWSCCNGHLDTARWIYSLGDVDIHILYDSAFRLSCCNGQLEIAQWIYSLGDVNIQAKDDYAFRRSCVNKFLETAQWLVSLCKQYKVVVENNRIVSHSVINEIDELMEEREYEDVCEKLNITQTTTTALSECIICYDCEDEQVLKLTCCVHCHVYCVKCLYNWCKKNPRKCVLCQSQFEWSDCKILTEQ
jgi:hypothetical protein